MYPFWNESGVKTHPSMLDQFLNGDANTRLEPISTNWSAF